MPEILVYGASDDLIEVECEELGISEEFSYSSPEDQEILLVGSHGQAVLIRPALLGDWTFTTKIISPGARGYEVIVSKVPRPDTEWKGDGDVAASVRMYGGKVRVFKVVPY